MKYAVRPERRRQHTIELKAATSAAINVLTRYACVCVCACVCARAREAVFTRSCAQLCRSFPPEYHPAPCALVSSFSGAWLTSQCVWVHVCVCVCVCPQLSQPPRERSSQCSTSPS